MLQVRGQAVALAVQMNFFWNVVTSYLFPLANASIGTHNTHTLTDTFVVYISNIYTMSWYVMFIWVNANYGYHILCVEPGPAATFGVFAMFTLLTLYFIYRFVPETKGLSLEEIEVLLGSRINPYMRKARTISVDRKGGGGGGGIGKDGTGGEERALRVPLLAGDEDEEGGH